MFLSAVISYIIYHNPRCSKSRQALAFLEEQQVDGEVVEYLKTPPTAIELLNLCRLLNQSPRDIIRTKESLYKELGLANKSDLTDFKWSEVLAVNPKLIERPIVVSGDKAVVGRLLENVLFLLS